MTTIIIKGAIYTDGDNLLRAHYTGEFFIVDCTEFKTVRTMLSEYSKETVKNFIKNDSYLTYEGKKYYECQYSPNSTKGMELLSDLSELDYFDEETNF